MLKGMGSSMSQVSPITLAERSGQPHSEESNGSNGIYRFIDIMSEPSFLDTHRKEDKERFARHSVTMGSSHHLVYDEELLGLEREMPWRARVTISRMRKDLKMVPYFQNMTGKRFVKSAGNSSGTASAGPPIGHSVRCPSNSDLAATSETRKK